MDFPKAPDQLGSFMGLAITGGVLGLETLPQLLDAPEQGVDPKRTFAAAALKVVLGAKGADGLGEACKAADLHAGAFLEADATLDPDAPSVADWLASQGLSAVPL